MKNHFQLIGPWSGSPSNPLGNLTRWHPNWFPSFHIFHWLWLPPSLPPFISTGHLRLLPGHGLALSGKSDFTPGRRFLATASILNEVAGESIRNCWWQPR